MLKIIDWYIGRTLLVTTFLTLASLISLSAIIKFIDQMRHVGDGAYEMWDALLFVLFSVPRDIELFFPMAVLLGSLLGLGSLASSSELTVMQAAGTSKLQIGGSVLKTAFPLMLMVMALGEWGAPHSQKIAREIEMKTLASSDGSIMLTRYGVWAKDNNSYTYFGRVDNEDTIRNINIWYFNDKNELTTYIQASSAEYLEGKFWRLNNAKETYFTPEQIRKEQFDSERWKSNLTPEKLSVVTVKPEELSLSGVYEYVGYLKDSQQDASRYELAFWRKVFQPLTIAVMMLMALSTVFGPLRSVSTGARVLSGIFLGFGFYTVDQVLGPMSLVYNFPSIVGAVGPSLLFLMLAVYMLQRKM